MVMINRLVPILDRDTAAVRGLGEYIQAAAEPGKLHRTIQATGSSIG
jgi:hypothetical protein